jgi:hypothetical protein
MVAMNAALVQQRHVLSGFVVLQFPGNRLRFREMIVFKPTLVYPEYLVAYKRA